MNKEFTELIFKHQNIIYKICSIYFGNRSNKEDYEQEIIIQLWKAFPSYKQQAKFSTWMYRVCLNSAIDIIRKEKNFPKYVKLEPDTKLFAEEQKKENPYMEKLYKAINQLSNIDKAIITLYLDEFSYKEIAEIAGISESNTGVKINRIKSQLTKMLENGNK